MVSLACARAARELVSDPDELMISTFSPTEQVASFSTLQVQRFIEILPTCFNVVLQRFMLILPEAFLGNHSA